MQSGKPVGIFRTHADAPRVLIANSNLVPHWATLDHFNRARSQGPDDVRPDDGRLLDLHRLAGHRAGHLRDLRRGRTPAITAAASPANGFSPPASAAWAARSRSPPPWRAPRCSRSSASPRASRCGCAPAISTSRPRTSTRRWPSSTAPAARRKPFSVGVLGNAAEIFPELVRRGVRPDVVTDQTSAHDPINGYLPEGWTPRRMAGASARAIRKPWSTPRSAPWRCMCSAMLAFHAWACRRSTTATTSARWRRTKGSSDAFDFPGFVPAYIRPLFCRGVGPFRWAALSGDPEDIYKTDAKVKELMPHDKHLHNWLDMARAAHQVSGPAGAHLLGRARRPPSHRTCLQRDGRARRTRRRRS